MQTFRQVFTSCLCLCLYSFTLMWPAPTVGQPQPDFLKEFPADDYEILDQWEERVGIGGAAKPYIFLNVKSNDGQIKEYQFELTGKRVDEPIIRTDVEPKAKIARELLDKFNDDQQDAERMAIIWLQDERPLPEGFQELYQDEFEPEITNADLPNHLQAGQIVQAVQQSKRNYEQVMQSIQNRRDGIRRHYLETIERFIADALPEGKEIAHRYALAAAVAVPLTQDEILQLAERDDVRGIYSDEEVIPESEPSVAFTSVLAQRSHELGWTGKNVAVAIVGEKGRIERENIHLNIRPQDIRQPNPELADSHATFIAGIIASQHDVHRGVAPDARVISASCVDFVTKSSLAQATDWAMRSPRRAAILSTSQGWGSEKMQDRGDLHFSDIYVDYVVHNGRILWVKSAGNRGDHGKGGRITSPGRGYNPLVVGNVDHRGTQDWTDDRIYRTSSHVNSVRATEKPEIVAYGTGLTSTTIAAPWLGTGAPGTSYSAPCAAGIAACCVQRTPELADEPQTLKAKLMVSGLAQNIEGASRLSGRDGAGVVKATAVRTGSASLTVRQRDFEPNGSVKPDFSIPLEAGVTKRIVLAYTHPPTSAVADPSARSHNRRTDLNLELYVDEKLVAQSQEPTRNPFEIIDYVPEKSGTAYLRIRRASWDVNVQDLRIGLAWASQTTVGENPSEPTLPDHDQLIEKWRQLRTEERRLLWKTIVEMTKHD